MAYEEEFRQLKQRYLQALDYEKNKYMQDSSDGKEWAEKTFLQVLHRMCELWELLTDEEKQKHMDLF